MRPCIYHESLSNPCFHLYNMRNKIFRNTEIQITGIQKYKLQNYRNTNCRYTDIQITDKLKYKLQKNRNTTYRSAEIQITEIQKYNLQKCRNTNYRITEIKATWVFLHSSHSSRVTMPSESPWESACMDMCSVKCSSMLCTVQGNEVHCRAVENTGFF